MNIIQRVGRHSRITLNAYRQDPQPNFLVLFINSICNMKCEHCFFWTSLNKKDDLTREELFELSRSLGPIENLNLSGGEPFIRKDFAEIVRQFITHNGVRQVYVPSNGYFTEKTVAAVSDVLKEPSLDLFVVELSLDGMPEFHDTFRVAKNSFRKAMETYDALVELQKRDPRLRIHAISTATDVNMKEIKALTTYLYERCPDMDHHNLAIIRGDRKNPALAAPLLPEYQALYDYIRRLWSPREKERYGSIVEPMLQYAKTRSIEKQTQYVPCRAGVLSAVVYSNGDVSVCELHEPLGNLRQHSFWEIWSSEKARKRRESVACKECWCTTEVFLWPSFTYAPGRLLSTMVAARAWEKPRPLPPGAKLEVRLEDAYPAPEASSEAAS